MLKILEARLQQYMNHELPDVQAGFRKGRETRDQIANIAGLLKKQQSSRITSTSALLTMLKTLTAATAAKSLQSCPTLCDPIDGSPPGSPVPGILQARTLEWIAIYFSHAWKWKMKVKSLSCVPLLATPWTAACQTPPSTGFSRQEYWSGMPFEGTNSKTPCSWNSGLQNCEKIISFV